MTISRRDSGVRRRRAATRVRAVGVASAALLSLAAVSGCTIGDNPSAAATVDSSVVSQNRVDSVVGAACAYTAASSGSSAPTRPTSLANLRASITQAMIQFVLTDKVTSAMHLSVSQAAISTAASQNSVPVGLSKKDTDALNSFFYDYAKSASQIELIGAHLTDPSITTSAQVTKDESATATKYISSYAAKQDISVNPAYGRWNGSAVVGGSGSLSDAVSSSAKDALAAAANSQADTSDLLPAQVC